MPYDQRPRCLSDATGDDLTAEEAAALRERAVEVAEQTNAELRDDYIRRTRDDPASFIDSIESHLQADDLRHTSSDECPTRLAARLIVALESGNEALARSLAATIAGEAVVQDAKVNAKSIDADQVLDRWTEQSRVDDRDDPLDIPDLEQQIGFHLRMMSGALGGGL